MNLRPNILFIVSDDTDPHYLGCYGGGYLTPHLDRLAREGVRFHQAHVASPMCVPGRYGYLTGQLPHRSRPFLERFGPEEPYCLPLDCNIPVGQETLATVMRRAGYRTGCVGKYHNCGNPDSIPGGMTLEALDPYDPRDRDLRRQNLDALRDHLHLQGWDYAEAVTCGNLDTIHNLEWTTEAGLRFLEEQRGSQTPFLLHFATHVIHGPEHSTNILDLDPRVSCGGLLDQPPSAGMPPRSSIPDRLRAAGVVPEHRSIGMLWLDDAVGALLAKLEDIGELENTIIIYTADHGVIGKWSCFDNGTRVPLIWRMPGAANRGHLSRPMVQNTDLLPTIAEVCGVPLPSGLLLDGRPYTAQLQGSQTSLHDALLSEMGYQRAIRTERFKLILNYQSPAIIAQMKAGAPVAANSRGKFLMDRAEHEHAGAYDVEQLYDLCTDPEEQLNLVDRPEFAAVLEDLKMRLQKRLHTFERPYPTKPDPWLLSPDYRRLVNHTRETAHCYDVGPWLAGGWF